MIGIAKSLVRMSGLITKELRDLARRPGAILSLIFGPLAIMAIFGLGYDGQRQPFDTIVILPQGSQLPHDVAYYQQMKTPGLRVIAVSEDR
ncbi:MAG TPA: hypothetical protein VFV20_07650, partial [Candidatus Limnocylindria bacterium]|nr:hypothetical protein [Candidatus Limnocylindria bacterium]